jgi:hypothetical protein
MSGSIGKSFRVWLLRGREVGYQPPFDFGVKVYCLLWDSRLLILFKF